MCPNKHEITARHLKTRALIILIVLVLIIGIIFVTITLVVKPKLQKNYNLSNKNNPLRSCALKTGNETYSYMVLLYVQFGKNNLSPCIGILIHKNYVLSVAHCLFRASNVYLRVGPNSFDIEKSRQLESGSFSVYPDYNNDTGENDIALIKLTEYVPVKPASLYNYEWSGENIDAVTLGRITDTNGTSSDHWLRKNVTIVNNNECSSSYTLEDVNSKICTLGEHGPFPGDSGGPLLCKNEVIGIVSGGGENGNTTWPVLYTHVGHYLEWINSVINES